MILAPAIMAAEKSPKNAAAKCLESVGLDSDMYRIGHTKARKLYQLYIYISSQKKYLSIYIDSPRSILIHLCVLVLFVILGAVPCVLIVQFFVISLRLTLTIDCSVSS